MGGQWSVHRGLGGGTVHPPQLNEDGTHAEDAQDAANATYASDAAHAQNAEDAAHGLDRPI